MGPRASIVRVACRGVVRVIFPRMMVPTVGRRGPVGRGMERVGGEFDFVEERVCWMGPGMLAQRLGP